MFPALAEAHQEDPDHVDRRVCVCEKEDLRHGPVLL